ncbi:MAG: 3-deoxy-8-phosphooctulonate synthase [Gammaproteobacteria bacterium]
MICHRGLRIGNDQPLVLFIGVNVLESEQMALDHALYLADICHRLEMPWVFKASFDKANRTSLASFRGPGIEEGLRILDRIGQETGAPLLTDIHAPEQAAPVAEVCDIIQIPAFLCRQTDLIHAAASTQAIIHIKKAQFLAAEDMQYVVEKCLESDADRIMLCERGTQFGYHNLVVDMLGFELMKQTGCPVSFDVTHSLQLPGAADGRASGRRQAVLKLAMAGISQGLAALFVECHKDPDQALCDGPCALPLADVASFLERVRDLDRIVKAMSGAP